MHPDCLPSSRAQNHAVASHFDVNVYIVGVGDPEVSCRASSVGYCTDDLGLVILQIKAHVGYIKQFTIELPAKQIDHISPMKGQIDIWLNRTTER